MPGPVTSFTDAQLFNAQLALQLACGRAHGAGRKKRNQWYCFLFDALKIEADLRGVPSPAAPFHTGDLPPFVA